MADHVVDLGVAARVQRGEGEVLELLLQVLHAEAVGQRRVDVDGLAGDALLLPVRQRGEGPHVVEPVGQLDDDDPQVAGHRHQHLAHRRGLLLLLGVELQPLELGDAVDQVGHRRAEVALDVGEGEPGVLDRVVQEGGGEGDVVEAEVGDDRGHRERVGDVGLTGLAALAAVGVVGDLVGPGDERRRRLGVPRPVHLEQRGDLDRGRG